MNVPVTEKFINLYIQEMYTRIKMVMDIFDAKIVCAKCNTQMEPRISMRGGAKLRAVQCPKCHEQILHPTDVANIERFSHLKGKTYNVKLRVVGNSHAISIPKEVVNFFHEQEKTTSDMVRLCFEDMKKMSLMFGGRNG